MRLALSCCLGLILASVTAQAATDPVYGYWLVKNKRAIVEIAPCGKMACGQIVWLAQPFNRDGTPKTDINNPDPAMKNRPLCGLRLLTDLDRVDPGTWENGYIYNGRDGSAYNVNIMTESADMLEVRGYLGISLFGKSQIWQRVSGNRGGCPKLRQPGLDR